jgi:hypothetical protein
MPPDQVKLRKVAGIAPRYQGSAFLANREAEFAAIKPIRGFYEVPGTIMGLSALLRNPPDGIIHFAGHGLVETVQGAAIPDRARAEHHSGPY